jgi:hypothetical protein
MIQTIEVAIASMPLLILFGNGEVVVGVWAFLSKDRIVASLYNGANPSYKYVTSWREGENHTVCFVMDFQLGAICSTRLILERLTFGAFDAHRGNLFQSGRNKPFGLSADISAKGVLINKSC